MALKSLFEPGGKSFRNLYRLAAELCEDKTTYPLWKLFQNDTYQESKHVPSEAFLNKTEPQIIGRGVPLYFVTHIPQQMSMSISFNACNLPCHFSCFFFRWHTFKNTIIVKTC